MIEQHWRIKEVAAKLNVSHQTATRMFEELPGVKIIGDRSTTKKKRRYRTILIPDSILHDYGRGERVVPLRPSLVLFGRGHLDNDATACQLAVLSGGKVNRPEMIVT